MLSAIAAALGGAAWVSTIGSGVVAIRLEAAGLPSESTVALMSAEHRFVIGAGYLVAPLAAALLAVVVDELLHAPRDQPDPGWLPRLLVALTVLVIAAAAIDRLAQPSPEFLLQVGAIAAVLGVVLRLGIKDRPWERVLTFVLVLAAVGAIALIAETRHKPRFHKVAISYRSGGGEDGFYITTTNDAVVLAGRGPKRHDGSCATSIVAVPRDQISAVRVQPRPVAIPQIFQKC